jgi:hypothetical protein
MSPPPIRIALIDRMIFSDRFGEIAKLNGFERHSFLQAFLATHAPGFLLSGK